MAKPTVPPDLTLTPDECRPGALPPVCAKCGAAASGETRVRFTCYPSWLGIILFFGFVPGMVLAYLVRGKRVAHMPVCAKHAGTWNWGNTVLAFTVGTVAVYAVALWALPVKRLNGTSPVEVALRAFFAVGVVAGGVIKYNGSPMSITETGLRLRTLAPAFVKAVVASRAREASPEYVTLTRA